MRDRLRPTPRAGEAANGARWGRTKARSVSRAAASMSCVRGSWPEGKEMALPSWGATVMEDWLGKWAMNLMLINVSTRKFKRRALAGRRRAGAQGFWPVEVGGLPALCGTLGGRLKDWMAQDISGLGLLVIQIDGMHVDDDMPWLRRSASMRTATSIRSAWSRARRKTRRPCRR